MNADARIRQATEADAAETALLLDRFNREFDEPSPGAEFLTGRVGELIASGAAIVLLAGEGPDGVLVMNLRPSLWSAGEEAYIGELYVVPERRRRGLGEALLERALAEAREAGADHVFLGTDEGDSDAHALYEKLGFTNRSGDELMLLYERQL